MTSEPNLPECCSEIAKNWDLQRLFQDMTIAKRKVHPRCQPVSPLSQKYICLLLSIKSPQDIAATEDQNINTVKSQCNAIYRDIDCLLEDKRIIFENRDNLNYTNSSNIYQLLDQAGYKRQHNSIISPHGYIKRGIEEQVCQALKKEGASLRIKGLKHTGKTYLLGQLIIPQAKLLGYLTASLSLLDIASHSDLNNEDRFLELFCNSIKEQLELELKFSLEDSHQQANPNDHPKAEVEEILVNLDKLSYTSMPVTGNKKVIDYITKILQSIKKRTLLLALDDVDYIFQYSNVANTLGQILLSIQTKPNRGQAFSEIFKKLRLVILHSTEEYAKLSKNFSPFDGVGIPFSMNDFDFEQAKQFLQNYQLKWSDSEIKKLRDLVGGHPYLIDMAFQECEFNNKTPNDLLNTACQESGIYGNLLRKYLKTLDEKPSLRKKFQQVIVSDDPIELDPASSFQLQSMGIIKLEGDHSSPRCELYRKYFQRIFGNRNDND
ncbi:MAG: AAA-like domain-containing protein [Phormidium sp.]